MSGSNDVPSQELFKMANPIKSVLACIFDAEGKVELMNTHSSDQRVAIRSLVIRELYTPRIVTPENPAGIPSEYSYVSPEALATKNAFKVSYYKKGVTSEFPQEWLEKYLNRDFTLDSKFLHMSHSLDRTYTLRFVLEE